MSLKTSNNKTLLIDYHWLHYLECYLEIEHLLQEHLNYIY